jgi:(1->4)-alpha-D-glucan 1-alpha-D-glucosylmutase
MSSTPHRSGPRAHLHRPTPGRPVPTATYRLQIHDGFGFGAAAERVPYLRDLGVSHLFLSPVLEAAPGSPHGYDVLDHARLSEGAGGRAAFERLVATCREHGLGIIVDVVPNHMTVPRPTHLNAPFWSLLREGRRSPHAGWFDVDWAAQGDRILMPVLGGSASQAIECGDLVLAADGGPTGREWVLRYHDNEFPVAPGTQVLPLPELVAAQWYRLASWREAHRALNYRRFFDVTSLIAVRVEDPQVFTATHALLLDLAGCGDIDGFRIDHPDGLADPAGYLDRLAERSGGAWVVVEKILEGAETLPSSWRCAGTTGYDALLRVQQALTWPDRVERLDQLWAQIAPPALRHLDAVVADAKRLVVADVQAAEVGRLMRLLRGMVDAGDLPALRSAVEALLVAMDRYRAYVVPGRPAPEDTAAAVEAAAERARGILPRHEHEALETVVALVLGRSRPEGQAVPPGPADEFRVRFQQTCGPVMAKGVEDTAFYRWLRLTGANEVGGDPDRLAIDPAEFHRWCAALAAQWPVTMTTLTTHDTKRSEDVRARLMVLAEDADGWAEWLARARAAGAAHRGERVDPPAEYLIWQTLVGTWPITGDRLAEYLLKAVREAKLHTAWVDGDAGYEEQVTGFARSLVDDPAIQHLLDDWAGLHEPSVRAGVLGQKLVQLTMPGVPDVYQGSETVIRSLVDPDNRRPVDWTSRDARLRRALAGEPALDLDDEKLWITATVLRLRRERPEVFVGESATYSGLTCGTRHALAFTRGDAGGPQVITVVTRAAGPLAASGGFGDAVLEVPPGQWRDLLGARVHRAGPAHPRLADVLAERPVALLVRHA